VSRFGHAAQAIAVSAVRSRFVTSGAIADLVLVSGRIRTPAHPSGFVQAAAIKAGVIAALGGDEEIREHIGPRTRVVNLRGRLAIPAFGDAHVHPVQGGLESLRCNLLGLRSRQQCLDAIAAYSAALAGDAWVLGGGWSMSGFPGGTPTAADLDPVTAGRPVFLPNRDHHTAWVNTAAMALAGITERTLDPPDGRIERDHAGVPTGALHDGAMRLVAGHVPPPSAGELTEALVTAQKHLHSLGITSIQDACVGEAGELGMPDAFDTYRRAAADRLLTCRVTGSLWWDRSRGLGQLADLQARREAAEASEADQENDGGTPGRFRATTVKLMLDGVCETFTAAMGVPYLDGHGHSAGHAGSLFIDPGELTEVTRQLSGLGFQMHFHAIGDRAITVALDTLAALPQAQRVAARHHLAHLQFISPPDLDRFARLGVVANFQPLWACEDAQNADLTVPFVGPERAAWQYRIGAVLRRGARVAFGSDWPVSSADPLQEMHVAVNRVLSARLGEPGSPETTSPLLPAEAITVAAAIDAFTDGVAFVNHEEDVAGMLAPGMLADLAVLDQDLYEIPPDEIGSTSVRLTIAGGQVVHGEE
jgi:predicted amidohydrolase YtcJ